jgi:flagellar biosynthetic protein FliQ
MDETGILHIVSGAMVIAAKLAGPILASCLAIGVVIALVQTVTQVQEMTLTFVPKLIGVAGVVLVGGHWMIGQMTTWVELLWQTIPSLK